MYISIYSYMVPPEDRRRDVDPALLGAVLGRWDGTFEILFLPKIPRRGLPFHMKLFET